jgi:hypothetical protein
MKITAIGCLSLMSLLGAVGAGCGPREYYVKPESGALGVSSVQRVYYTPEQRAARDAALGYTFAAPAPSPSSRPVDAELSAIQERWPNLTAEQRATLVRTVKEMTDRN